MERTSVVQNLSSIETQIEKFKPKPRKGQRRVLEGLLDFGRSLNIKLPTGYGKTYTALCAYSILRSVGKVNRLLVIFPSDGQLVQFEQSTPSKLRDYAIDGKKSVCDVRFFGAQAIAKHQRNDCEIFAITVQSLIGSRGMDNISTMLQRGRWMIVVDEYHHYGIDKPFSAAVSALNYEFLLCMSATPHRANSDGAFGGPEIEVSYREAVKENAVKPLCGHSYHYKIDAVNGEGEVISFTTKDLIEAAGSDSDKAIEKLLIDKKLRWSPKYISPLITNPIDRMLSERLRTGKKLQAIVGAMCVSHAELVCDQIRSTFPDLNVEWVGTGENGRTPEDNAKIIRIFSDHTADGKFIDVLVHVGMAGEGLDTVYVSEVVHLNSANVNNSNLQENGRASRYLPGVIGHINFDASSGFALGKYIGSEIELAMDMLPPSGDNAEPVERDPSEVEWNTIPDEPVIGIIDVECISIDSGDETVKLAAKWFASGAVNGFDERDLSDESSPIWEAAIKAVRKMRAEEAASMNEKSTVKQWGEAVNNALAVVTGNITKLAAKGGARFDKNFPGDIKKRINGRKKFEIGPIDSKDIDCLRKHYQWIKNLDVSLSTSKEIPSWLS